MICKAKIGGIELPHGNDGLRRSRFADGEDGAVSKAGRHARHYTGNLSEINVGKAPFYGTFEPSGGPGSANSSGELKRSASDDGLEAKREAEAAAARHIVKRMRKKKAEARKRRAEAKERDAITGGQKPKKRKKDRQALPDDWEGMQREIVEANRKYQRGEITLRECNELREDAIRRRRR